MSQTYQNLCIRCGKKRIVARSWIEKTEYSTVKITEMICPDADCQKQVEMQNKKQVDKYHLMNKKSEERKKQRIAATHHKKKSRKTS